MYVYVTINRAADVPYSDYFTTEHMFTVSAGSSPQSCRVLITSDVLFNKSTWFEGKIRTGSNEGALKSYTLWMALAQEHMQRSAAAASRAVSSAGRAQPPSTPER